MAIDYNKFEDALLKRIMEVADFIDDKEADTDFEDLEDKDVDNDGDSDESDEYLHHKLGVIARKAEQTDKMTCDKCKDAPCNCQNMVNEKS